MTPRSPSFIKTILIAWFPRATVRTAPACWRGSHPIRKQLHDLFQLEGATNERLLGEANLLPGITVHELVFGIPNWHIVNAAFTHARPEGSRFNGADRGAWYSAFTLETAQAEVAFHFAQSLREVNWQESETATYREYLADFRGEFHDIRKSSEYAGVPRSGELCRVTTTGCASS